MFKPKFIISNQMASALTAIERARGFLEAAVLSPNWMKEMQRKALILEAYHTTHIERAYPEQCGDKPYIVCIKKQRVAVLKGPCGCGENSPIH